MNIDKLVIIQLAQASLDRLKLDPYGYIDTPSSNPPYIFKNNRAGTFTYNYNQCKTTECRDAYRIVLNERTYFVEVTATQNRAESDSKLINIITTIKDEAQKKDYSVEGYVIVYE